MTLLRKLSALRMSSLRHLGSRVLVAERGSVTLEFGVAGGVLVLVTMGMLGAGLVGWTRSGLQATANATARCVALGAPACAGAQAYAVTLAGRWVFPGVITDADVSVTSATTCNGATGQYTRVTISSSHWASVVMPVPHDAGTLSVTACHISAT